MVPVLGAEKLMIDPVLVGALISVEGLGATLGALTIAATAQPRHFTRIYTYASISFLVVIAAFALVPYYWLAIPLLFIGGFGMSGFGTMQSIIVVSSTRPEMRGRVLGVLAVAIGSGPDRRTPHRMARNPNRHRYSRPNHRISWHGPDRHPTAHLAEVSTEYSEVSDRMNPPSRLCIRHSGESRNPEGPGRGHASAHTTA